LLCCRLLVFLLQILIWWNCQYFVLIGHHHIFIWLLIEIRQKKKNMWCWPRLTWNWKKRTLSVKMMLHFNPFFTAVCILDQLLIEFFEINCPYYRLIFEQGYYNNISKLCVQLSSRGCMRSQRHRPGLPAYLQDARQNRFCRVHLCVFLYPYLKM
jgi:hypothetical protein